MEGRDERGALLPRGPVTPQATFSLGEVGEVDALPDRRADARVRPRTDESPARRLLQPDRVARLVPGRPVPHGRQVDLVEVVRVRNVVAAVARRRGVREVAQVRVVRRRHVLRLAAVCPRRREQDAEHRLHAVLRGIPNGAVVDRPVVGRVRRILRMRRTPLRDLVPVEVDPNDLGAQALQRAEGELRIAVQRHRIVLNSDEHVLLRLRRGHGETCSDENDRRRDPDTPTQRPAPVRSSAACVAGLLRAGSRAPSRAAGARG